MDYLESLHLATTSSEGVPSTMIPQVGGAVIRCPYEAQSKANRRRLVPSRWGVLGDYALVRKKMGPGNLWSASSWVSCLGSEG
jgi:hypothetical protein